MTNLVIGNVALTLERKPIKNLTITVVPPVGQVRVSAPQNMSDTALRLAIIGKLSWIKKQQRELIRQERQSAREMISGESHYLWGKSYRLEVIKRHGKHEIILGQNRLQLYVSESTNTNNREKVLEAFYREELKQRLALLIPYWQEKMGITASFWGIKKMKTKWGSCNTDTARLWFNLELAKKSHQSLDYVVVHELAHLIERRHNERFKAVMDTYLPNWQEARNQLNQQPLSEYKV